MLDRLRSWFTPKSPQPKADETPTFQDVPWSTEMQPVVDIAVTDPAVTALGHERWVEFLDLWQDDKKYRAWWEANKSVAIPMMFLVDGRLDRGELIRAFGSGKNAQPICSYVKSVGGLLHAIVPCLPSELDNDTRYQLAQSIATTLVQASSSGYFYELGHYYEWSVQSWRDLEVT